MNAAEKNYWPKELEIVGIVWVVKKLRHMIESTKVKPFIVYTDHSTAVPISAQTSITSSSTTRLNIRLIRASQYLSAFDIDIHHKDGKANVVADALSRLKAAKDSATGDTEGILDALAADTEYIDLTMPHIEVCHSTLVELSADTKARVKEAYHSDKSWKKIYDMVLHNTPPRIRFKCQNELLYFIKAGKERLCVPSALGKEVFQLTHDEHHHSGFHHSYERISAAIYMRHPTRRLKKYHFSKRSWQLRLSSGTLKPDLLKPKDRFYETSKPGCQCCNLIYCNLSRKS